MKKAEYETRWIVGNKSGNSGECKVAGKTVYVMPGERVELLFEPLGCTPNLTKSMYLIKKPRAFIPETSTMEEPKKKEVKQEEPKKVEEVKVEEPKTVEVKKPQEAVEVPGTSSTSPSCS